MTTILAASALVFSSDSNYAPPFVSFWIFLGANTAFKLFLIAAISCTEYVSIFPIILLVLQICLFQLWYLLLKQKYHTLAIITIASICVVNTVYMIAAFSILYIPYAGWCIALMVWNIVGGGGGKEEEPPILPQRAPLPITAVPPRIRLFPPPAPPARKK
jgi:hypothetical protein